MSKKTTTDLKAFRDLFNRLKTAMQRERGQADPFLLNLSCDPSHFRGQATPPMRV